MQVACEQINLEQPGPWGFWATMGLSAIVGGVYIIIEVVVIALFTVAAMVRTRDLDISQFAESLLTDGLFFSVATCAAAPPTVGLIVLFARLRKGISVGEYLCLQKPELKELCKWCFALLLFAAACDSLTYLMGRPLVPDVMVRVYRTARFAPLLWLAFVIAGPISEELFFRGFLFRGIENSRFGPAGAIIVTSLTWAVLHTQYDGYGVAIILLGGLLLGFARYKSNSTFVPFAMHVLQNAIATAEVAILLKMGSNAA